jgi:Bacterial Ig-like domain (group 3)/Invasin, domain 3
MTGPVGTDQPLKTHGRPPARGAAIPALGSCKNRPGFHQGLCRIPVEAYADRLLLGLWGARKTILIAGTRAVITGLSVLLVMFLSGIGVASAAGAPTDVFVQLSPASIVASGISTTTVTATVLDATTAPVAGQMVVFSAPYDPQITFGPTHDNGDGTYSATLTSSRVAETTPIFGAAGSATVHPATLTQLAASTTSLAAASDAPLTSTNGLVTNQGVTLLSTVTSFAQTVVPPSGTVEFEDGGAPISGCGAVQIPVQSTASVTVECATSFAIPSSLARFTAVFNPTPGSLLAGSVSQPAAFSIDKDSTSTTVTTPDSTPKVDGPVTYTALVAPSQAGPLTPTGDVTFADGGRVIRSCTSQPVRSSSTATCTVRYPTTGQHTITASYGGDDSFNGSSSPATAIGVQPLGTIAATLQWQFYYTPSYTVVRQLIVNGVSPGVTVVLECHGRGCPFAKSTIAVRPTKRCGRNGRHRCGTPGTIDLTSRLGDRRLLVGSRITVETLKPGWVAKDYIFAVRSSRKPSVRIGCTAPGRTAIGVGC